MLAAIERGEPQAPETFLPLVYNELRRLAAQKLSQEKPGQTLQATALVHEAWLRLVGDDYQQQVTEQEGAHFVPQLAAAFPSSILLALHSSREV